MRHKLCYRPVFYIFIFTIGMVLWFSHFSYAQEEIRLSTFYPSPSGEYDEIAANSIFFNKTTGLSAHRLIAFDVGAADTFNTRLRITAGSSDTGNNHQGACIDLHGNNHLRAGDLDLVAGRGVAAPGGDILFFTGNPNALEVMRIDSAGNVGIGMIADASYSLDVNGDVRGTSWANSDLRYKTNIMQLPDPLKKILLLRAVEFDWKREEFKDKNFPQNRDIGIIAQELEEQYPQLVMTDGQGYKSIAYAKLTAVLLEAIKSQQKQIDKLQQDIEYIKVTSTE